MSFSPDDGVSGHETRVKAFISFHVRGFPLFQEIHARFEINARDMEGKQRDEGRDIIMKRLG